MGQCGVFVICYRVTHPGQKQEVPRGTDIAVAESKGGELVLQAVKEADNPPDSKNAA